MKFNLSKINFSQSDIDKKIILPNKMTPDLAEEIGLHIGDGSMNFYSNKGLFQLRGHIEDDKPHYENRIKKLYNELYNLDVNIREMKSTGVIGFQIWNSTLVEFKSKIIGLPLGVKGDIKIPSLINNKELFFSFLKGLFDTDGCLYIENKRGKPYPRIEIGTTSQALCLGVLNLAKKYGLNASYYISKRKEKNWKDLYKIAFNGFDNLEEWIKHVSSNNPKHLRKFKNVQKNRKV